MHGLMKLFNKGECLLIAVLGLILDRSRERLLNCLRVVLKKIKGVFEGEDHVRPCRVTPVDVLRGGTHIDSTDHSELVPIVEGHKVLTLDT